MSSVLRNCVVGTRFINKYWKPLLSIQNKSNQLFLQSDIKCSSNNYASRPFHTSNIVYKIVAFNLSDIGEGIREVVIKEWFVKEGDKVQQFDNICEVQSDKAAVTITSRYDGIVTKLYHQVDQTALVGQPLVDIDVADEGSAEVVKKEALITENNSKDEIESNEIRHPNTKILTTPAVRRIAAQFNVDLKTVKATGKNGRLMKEDLLSHLNITAEKSNEIPDMTAVQTMSIPFTEAHVKTELLMEDKMVPVTGFTKAMIKSMTEAMEIPHFVYSDEYNVTNLIEARKILKPVAEKQGVKLTYMPIIVKAASLSLTQFPIINSSLDNTCENLIYKSSHNIGIAMDTPNGLIVPVIKNVHSKSIIEIARELNILQEKGAQGKLGIHELNGGTFTISNIGIIGGTYTKPIIFSPQVSIGALGKIQVLPRFDDEGNIIKAHIMSVSWSADHRIIDGVTMARFSNQIKHYLENPYTLLLDI